MWSWHIWVYGGNDLRSINVKNNKAKSGGRPGEEYFNFLSENLGAGYAGNLETYPEINVWVKISNGRKTEVIKVTRLAGPSTLLGYNIPYYQSGRKDPMLPSNGISNNNKVWYNKGGASNNNLLTAKWVSDGSLDQANAEIANTIKNPQTFNTSSSADNLYCNLWDANCNETIGITTARFLPVAKSVYDPCPPGFCLPPNGAFTGFTSTGQNSYTSSEWNVSGSFDKGWHFRTVLKDDPDPAIDPTIFLPDCGFRFQSGALLLNSGNSYYLSSVRQYGYGGQLSFTYNNLSPLDYGYPCSLGFAVRPVVEN